jgi:rRNA maturation endonuclease Nob1
MSAASDTPGRDLDRIVVLDTSALIEAKTTIRPQRQWEFFEILKERVQRGQVYFPKAVREELRGRKHHDTPETWALNVHQHIPGTVEPSVSTLREVMRVAGDVVESDAEGDPADPYVLAQALEFQESGRWVSVVTEDRVDRAPIKIAMTTACARLGLTAWSLAHFLGEIGFDP